MKQTTPYRKHIYWLDPALHRDAIAEFRKDKKRVYRAKHQPCEALYPRREVALVEPEVWDLRCRRQGSWYRSSRLQGKSFLVTNRPLTEFTLWGTLTLEPFHPPRTAKDEDVVAACYSPLTNTGSYVSQRAPPLTPSIKASEVVILRHPIERLTPSRRYMEHDAIAVIDFGGQYAHLIATKIRRHHVLSEIRQPEDPLDLFERYKGIIISGSPALSSHGEESAYNKKIYELDIPILGFCFGHQEIAKHYGGRVAHGGREWAHADMHLVREHPLFKGLGPVEKVWMSHFDSVTDIGPGFEELGYTILGATGKKHHFAAIQHKTCEQKL